VSLRKLSLSSDETHDKSFLLSLTAAVGFCAPIDDDDDERRLSRRKQLVDHNTNVEKKKKKKNNNSPRTRRPHPRRSTPPAG